MGSLSGNGNFLPDRPGLELCFFSVGFIDSIARNRHSRYRRNTLYAVT
jgi:hypothetical protein